MWEVLVIKIYAEQTWIDLKTADFWGIYPLFRVLHDLKLNVPYKVLDSYEKTLDGTSRHFFLIQEAEGSTNPPLIEIPLDNNFTYYNYSDPKGQLLKDSTNQYFDSQVLNS